ncbi:MAG: hypothetical protein KBD67_09250 [Anaerolineaceae bacterium]|nr:hypothetical protein [Anaerolineaceae bacterium]
MTDAKTFSFVRPTIATPFHIDFEWWKEHDSNWRVFLQSCLCEKHQAEFQDLDSDFTIDWIDNDTAEVHQLNGLQSTLMDHCAKADGFLVNQSLVNAVFRVFLSNGNAPLNSTELSDRIGKPADTILRTLSSLTVYKGLRPCR